MDSITGCNFYTLGSTQSFFAHNDKFIVLRRQVHRCYVYIFVWRDSSRVYISGGEYGYDWVAREADDIEIDALAERFDLPELRKVLAVRSGDLTAVEVLR